MKRLSVVVCGIGVAVSIAVGMLVWNQSAALAQEKVQEQEQAQDKARDNAQASAPGKKAIERSRRTVQTLDNIFKQTIVLVTDKYVNDDDDFAAGSAAVLLFKNISDGSDNTIRLIDATGDPYEADNVAKDKFEKEGINKLKAGAKTVDEVITQDGKHYLRALTPVPVVMDKCIMCHAHYADVKKGEPIGAISYTVPID